MSIEGLRVGGLSAEARERLSALADGEAGAEDLQLALSAWREDGRARAGSCETWHAYHLIGDVMRSEDLCGSGRDDLFLSRLRARLAEEPVVIAPSGAAAREGDRLPLPAQVANGAPLPTRRRSWVAPMATAAGVMAVAGVLVVTRLSVPPSSPVAGAQLAQAAAPAAASAALQQVSASAVPSPAETAVVVGNGTLVRDARLDQYLNAHKQFGGSSALGVPSGFLRGATYEGPNR
ncbi:sigma-E factor negative regulatory protein [Aquabacterium sp. A7-Y]|uniref:sigma-E factor negative regulatory protein n=1 Tax=Aquabacterium sp. A7-Y TaxID=1349605 RepID=UPI00223E0FF3|nr:sigma-E factor negative regulatory protein [Aquabacterium sp. A7-Y]MCW7541804.1 sigma-E factor negative regulatory protein [Aquabacterium sp. A7-Y]